MTLDDDEAAQVHRVTKFVRGELGDDLPGMVLYGSAVAKPAYRDNVAVSWNDVLLGTRTFAAFVEREIRCATVA